MNPLSIIKMKLIEPSFYFGIDEMSSKRFVNAYLGIT